MNISTRMNRFVKYIVILVAFWGGNPSVICAQNFSDSLYANKNHELKGDTLDEVIVTAARIHSEIIPAQVLSGERLKQLNTVSVADAIRYFSGVQIKDYGGIGGLKTVNIRSMGTQHVGVFYDGIQLGNAQNGQIDLGKFSMDNMETISLYNGQKSNTFQPAKDFASASSVYLTARKPTFEGENRKNNLSVSVKSGSFGTINPSLLWEHKFNSRLNSSLNVEYLYTTGRYKFSYTKKDGYDTTEVRRNGDVQAIRIESGLFGQIDNGEWRVKAYLYDSERGYPGASVREEPGKFRHEDRQWDTNFFVQGSIRKNLSSFYSFLFNGKYAYDFLRYLSDPRKDVSTMYVDNHYHQQEAYFSLANDFSLFKCWNINLSSDFQFNTLDADLTDFVYPSRYTLLTALATSIRLDRFKMQASLLHTYVHDATKTSGSAAADKNKFTPTVALSWKPFGKADFNVRAFYKRIFRMPTLNDLYYTFIGNKYLNPEYATQYNIGLVYSFDTPYSCLRRMEFQADAYFNQVDDKIIAMPTSNQFQWTMINLGNVEIKGVDFVWQTSWVFGKVGLNTRMNYTYQKAQDFTDSSEEWYGDQIPYIPWHSGSAIMNLEWKGWGVNYSFIYTGERYESRANIPENYSQPWYTHDISMTKTFHIKKLKTMLAVEVNNLFNQQYEVVQCYPMPGTNFKIKLNITI